MLLLWLLSLPSHAVELPSCSEFVKLAAEAVIQERQQSGESLPKFDEPNLYGSDINFSGFHDLIDVKVEEGTLARPIPAENSDGFAQMATWVTLKSGRTMAVLPSDMASIDSSTIAKQGKIPVDHASVQKVTTSKGEKYFRPMADPDTGLATKARRTLAASILNRSLKLQVFVNSVWARINGELGALSDAAKGLEPKESLDAMVKKGLLTVEAASEYEAYSFFIGDFDATRVNVRVLRKKIKSFDADFAFVPLGILTQDHEAAPERMDRLAGVRLPEKYTQRFVDNLKKLTPKKLEQKLEYYLSRDELDALIFRREVILKDIERRGDAAILS